MKYYSNKELWNNKEFNEEQKCRIIEFLDEFDEIMYKTMNVKHACVILENKFKNSSTSRESRLWADIASRFNIIRENTDEILAYKDIVNPVKNFKVTVTVNARSRKEAEEIAQTQIATVPGQKKRYSDPF